MCDSGGIQSPLEASIEENMVTGTDKCVMSQLTIFLLFIDDSIPRNVNCGYNIIQTTLIHAVI